jgi:hypothetical protein
MPDTHSCSQIRYMKKLMPLLIRWFVIIFLVLFLLSVARDLLIKSAIEMSSPQMIGAKVEMGSFSLGLLTHQIHIKNFRLYNPPGFPTHVFLDVPEIAVDVDVPALIKGRMHFSSVVFNMDQMIIFKNKEGKLNVDSLKIIEEQKAANKGKPMKLPVFKIDLLELNIGKVIFEDYTHAPPVRVEAYDVDIKDQKVRNINGLPKLAASVIVEAMKPTAIRSAGLFAAEALLGIGFLPAIAIGVAIAQDNVNADLDHSFDETYQASLKLVQDNLGTVKKTETGSKEERIYAKVYGCDITITVQDKGWGKSYIRIKARQYMLAKLEIANGLLYQLTERLK